MIYPTDSIIHPPGLLPHELYNVIEQMVEIHILFLPLLFSDKEAGDQSAAWPRKTKRSKVTQRNSDASSRYSLI